MEWELPNRIHIIKETHNSNTYSYDKHDEETFQKERRKITKKKYHRAHDKKYQEDSYSSTIRNWFSSLFRFVEMWSIEETKSFPDNFYPLEKKKGKDRRTNKEDEGKKKEVHSGLG